MKVGNPYSFIRRSAHHMLGVLSLIEERTKRKAVPSPQLAKYVGEELQLCGSIGTFQSYSRLWTIWTRKGLLQKTGNTGPETRPVPLYRVGPRGEKILERLRHRIPAARSRIQAARDRNSLQ